MINTATTCPRSWPPAGASQGEPGQSPLPPPAPPTHTRLPAPTLKDPTRSLSEVTAARGVTQTLFQSLSSSTTLPGFLFAVTPLPPGSTRWLPASSEQPHGVQKSRPQFLLLLDSRSQRGGQARLDSEPAPSARPAPCGQPGRLPALSSENRRMGGGTSIHPSPARARSCMAAPSPASGALLGPVFAQPPSLRPHQATVRPAGPCTPLTAPSVQCVSPSRGGPGAVWGAVMRNPQSWRSCVPHRGGEQSDTHRPIPGGSQRPSSQGGGPVRQLGCTRTKVPIRGAAGPSGSSVPAGEVVGSLQMQADQEGTLRPDPGITAACGGRQRGRQAVSIPHRRVAPQAWGWPRC